MLTDLRQIILKVTPKGRLGGFFLCHRASDYGWLAAEDESLRLIQSTTFDGSLPSEAQGKESSIKIGQTYFLDCIGEKGELGTVSGRRTPIMTRRRSTFPAGQLADPDELQVEFERRVARLLIASSANFIPISAAWFVCDWSLFAKAGLRIVAVRHRINLHYEHPLSESPRKPTQTATTRQACQAS
jgi:hypothetical protein